MPRKLTNTEIWKRLTGLSMIRPRAAGSGGANTLTTAVALAGAAALTVAAITTFANFDPVLIVSANGVEANEINAAPSANTLSLRWKLSADVAIGATVYRGIEVPMGRIEQGGLTLGKAQQTTDINAADVIVAIGRLPGQATFTVSGSLLGFNLQNLQFIVGATETEIGTGVITDPYQGRIDGNSIGTQGLQVARVKGLTADSTIVWVDCNECSVSANGQTSLNSQTPAALPFELQYTSEVYRFWQ